MYTYIVFVLTSIFFPAVALQPTKRRPEKEEDTLLDETLSLVKNKITVSADDATPSEPVALQQDHPQGFVPTEADQKFETFLQQLWYDMARHQTGFDCMFTSEEMIDKICSENRARQVPHVKTLDAYLASHDVSRPVKYEFLLDIWNSEFANKKIYPPPSRRWFNYGPCTDTFVLVMKVLLKHGADPHGDLIHVIVHDYVEEWRLRQSSVGPRKGYYHFCD